MARAFRQLSSVVAVWLPVMRIMAIAPLPAGWIRHKQSFFTLHLIRRALAESSRAYMMVFPSSTDFNERSHGTRSDTPKKGLENRLAETSPYLLQHKDNPVHWQPWDAKLVQKI